MTNARICFVGDSLTAGTGDAECRGWPGRLCAEEIGTRGHDLSCYNLGVRAETSAQIAARWEAECRPRLPEHVDGRLTFMFGLNDMADQEGAGQRLSHARSVETARAMLSRARSWRPTLWLGPTPPRREPPQIRPGPGVTYLFHRDRVADLNDRYKAVAAELDIPYCDLFGALAEDADWNRDMAAGDGVHPTAEGYRMLARRIADWSDWRGWFS
ncbi:GDSL family lipase [Marivibrio halodurans]|uniref:GDSL family lipase n=1 Tax=Marivibrio halodurans TaxID=2039722 RepID=A0A8J7S068_9PROT|nr:GDSL-type esterase/lipase family protein [Marivibrio halodurans]MBP5856274.1 GDSL family lipase [Marivibrio halodurans]